ncbi:acyltransferase family protein [Nocardioides mangrovi]|uniref:Acyltransferase n=1 Tax=Nocardioides mangrovi TaxID=2874580 RepID=A0ABS7UC72_9ACTN|nr:acyltransferase family protein [Nocardioides mangrovi]MBZ5738604.1 acyltransferase [Nocardioides mangrovi]
MGSPDVRLDIQGLRCVAVGAVVADHAGVRHLAGGYVGVDVFLVVSGFLITSLLLREADRDGRISLRGFYARRARRILPAATVVLVAVAIYSASELSYVRTVRVLDDVRWAAAFLANVHFARSGTDYFSAGLPPSPVQHYWSLAVEEQFYLVWPALIAALLLVARRRRIASPRRLVAAVLAGCCAASLTWSVVHTASAPTAAFFSSLARAWELGAGALLALAATRLLLLPRLARHCLALAGLVAIGLAMTTYDATTALPGYHALVPVLGTVAVLAAGVGSEPVGVARVLSVRPMTWIGDLSYSLYLWHWPVLVLAGARLGHRRTGVETAVLLLAVLALAAASYYLVENPVRRSPRLRPSLRSLALWPGTLALVGCSVLAADRIASDQLADRVAASQKWAALRDQAPTVGAELTYSLQLADDGAPIAFPLVSADQIERLQDDRWHRRYTCNAYHDRTSTRLRPVGDIDADRTMVVLGDSHAGQWLPALDLMAQRDGYRLVPVIKYGCVPYPVALLTENRSRNYTECADFRRWAFDQIAELQPDLVYVGSRAMPPNMTVRGSDADAAWYDGVASALADLTELAPDVRMIGDVSMIGLEPADCLTDRHATMASCTATEKKRTVVANRLGRRAANAAGVPFVPVAQLACQDGRCPAFAGARMVYADHSHLSIDWVEHVWHEFDRLVAETAGAGGR